VRVCLPAPASRLPLGQKRWESLLHFMVATDTESASRPETGWRISKEVKDELLAPAADGTSLMQREKLASKITQAGFQFLLRPVQAQVWQLVMQVVHRRRTSKGDKKGDTWLATVMQVSFCTLGAGTHVSSSSYDTHAGFLLHPRRGLLQRLPQQAPTGPISQA